MQQTDSFKKSAAMMATFWTDLLAGNTAEQIIENAENNREALDSDQEQASIIATQWDFARRTPQTQYASEH